MFIQFQPLLQYKTLHGNVIKSVIFAGLAMLTARTVYSGVCPLLVVIEKKHFEKSQYGCQIPFPKTFWLGTAFSGGKMTMLDVTLLPTLSYGCSVQQRSFDNTVTTRSIVFRLRYLGPERPT